jgi:RHS repeat-associated protein
MIPGQAWGLNDAIFNLADPDGDGYDAYGKSTTLQGDWTSRSGTPYAWRQRFQGLRYDGTGGGMYSVRNRDLNVTTSRWNQQDPLGYVDGANLYEFVGSDPATSADPFGLSASNPGYVTNHSKSVVWVWDSDEASWTPLPPDSSYWGTDPDGVWIPEEDHRHPGAIYKVVGGAHLHVSDDIVVVGGWPKQNVAGGWVGPHLVGAPGIPRVPDDGGRYDPYGSNPMPE